MSQERLRKSLVQQLHEAENPKFAVFLRSPSGRNAKFSKLHDSIETAIEAARTHAAEVAGRGTPDFTYYVVEIKHRVGIEHGRLVDQPMA